MKTKLHFVLSITIFFIGFCSFSQEDYWQKMISKTVSTQLSRSGQESLYNLDKSQFLESLGKVKKDKAQVIQFPDHLGNIHSFEVYETPVFHPDLAKKYPTIQSFTGISLNGKLKIRFSHSQNGLQAMIIDLENHTNCFLQKEKTTSNTYRAFEKNIIEEAKTVFCSTINTKNVSKSAEAKGSAKNGMLRKYRIAISASGEYTQYHGGTVSDALSAINATLTNVNAVFETDLLVTLELVAQSEQVIFTNPATDPYSNSNLNAQTQNTLTNAIGELNYDVGHLFHQGDDDGNAGCIGCVCIDNQKGSAFATNTDPEGPFFDLDYVAHELGHQFGANHTWSHQSEGTGVQVEPASGTTIMGYAGIVGGNNVAPNGDDYFHHVSIVQIKNYLQSTTCSMNVTSSNNPPVLEALSDYAIPKGTAFVLSANATDPDGDQLTYTWEQIDNGVVTASSFGPNNSLGANFRSLPPSTEPQRYFPKLSRILNGDLEQINPQINDAWETVSNIAREMNFAVTVRDNRIGGGQIASGFVKIDVIDTDEPFMITSQTTNETYVSGSVLSISWNVANTNQSPINADTVDIFLSTDGGLNFNTLLAQDVQNTGSTQVQLPSISTNSARIMIKPNNNVFFAVNATEFIIEESNAILNFDTINYKVCKSSNSIAVPFTYETYGGFAENMTLSVNSVQPFIANFSQDSVSSNNTPTTLTLENIANIPAGVHSVEVIATGSSYTTAVVLKVTVLEDNLNNVVLISPPNDSEDTINDPEFVWQGDDNFGAYDIEIATDETFNTIIESATVAFPAYKTSGLQPATSYFWRVKPRNICGEGTFGSPFHFTTSNIDCGSLYTRNFPLVISEVGTPTVIAELTSVEDLRIVDVNVNIELTHTFLRDLTVSVISPSGTRVVLFSNQCLDMDNVDAVFDDDGQQLNCSGTPAITGLIKPAGALSSFAGESTLGVWTLEVIDNESGDGGSLNAFSLDICAEGIFRPDLDKDGFLDDGDDLCLNTPEGIRVGISGCPLNSFSDENFSVLIEPETCIGNNDGMINLTAQDTAINYIATLSGMGLNTSNSFTSATTFANLPTGNYQLLIEGTNGVIDFISDAIDLTITQPEELLVNSELLENSETLQLQISGEPPYTIQLNGMVLQETTENDISIALPSGINTVKVTSEFECRGVFEKEVFITDAPVIFPNPVNDLVTIQTILQDQNINVYIYALGGRLIRQEAISVIGYAFELDIAELSSGMYYMVLESNASIRASKFLKY